VGRIAFAIAVLAVLASCAKHHAEPPKAPADYSEPVWYVAIADHSGGLPVAKAQEIAQEYQRVTHLWLEFWRKRSNGTYRPASIPTGAQFLTIEYVKTCSNSAEEEGKGPYGAKIHVWSCTYQKARGKAYTIKAACHRLSHAISGLSGENAVHKTFREVCGC